jgi:hypothetical protein
MQVPFSRLNIKMPEQVFYIPDVGSFIRQVGGKTVPQAMNANLLADTRFIFCLAKNLLNSTGWIGRMRLFRLKQIQRRRGLTCLFANV